MPMIGARFYTQLDAAQMRNDVIEEDLAKVNHSVGATYGMTCFFWAEMAGILPLTLPAQELSA